MHSDSDDDGDYAAAARLMYSVYAEASQGGPQADEYLKRRREENEREIREQEEAEREREEGEREESLDQGADEGVVSADRGRGENEREERDRKAAEDAERLPGMPDQGADEGVVSADRARGKNEREEGERQAAEDSERLLDQGAGPCTKMRSQCVLL